MSNYLRISPYKGYDDYYVPLDGKDETWGQVLSELEYALDEQYNQYSDTDGIELHIKITSELPDDVEGGSDESR